ncbi:DNA polymerase sliding clamp [Halorarum salinum]|uniref:DNA polymerase sliding clamp n=1 Tax=Halorarum salinum TaxID=2743089 RepID=A0A7D5QEG6_9EURY|nr:DNA polymerase sliding clamp [Halobaculum salinum]QLG62861.1 DNA polymerase sliding clamp [Halobaculum salinum]
MSVAEQRETFEAIIDAQVLQQTIDTLQAVVQEAIFTLDEDGIRAAAVDPGNVAMTRVDLDAAAFESYWADGGRIGVNLTRLDDIVSKANADDIIHLELDEETRKLNIRFRNVDVSMALIDPDAIRKEPDLPNLDDKWHADLHVEAAMLSEAVDIADLISDHVRFRSVADEGVLHVEAQGDTDDSDVTVEGDDLLPGSEIGEDCNSLLSLGYFTDLFKPVPNDAEVRLRHGTEHPVLFEYEFADGHGFAEGFQAPRVEAR